MIPITTTNDFLQALRTEIKNELFEEVVALVTPQIEAQLYHNTFTLKDATAYLKISESTIRRLVKEQEIPHYKLRGVLYFRQWELDQYVSDLMIGKPKPQSKKKDHATNRVTN